MVRFVFARFPSLLLLSWVIGALFCQTADARFISPDDWDPTKPGVGTNRYAYSENDPVNKSDPNGHQDETPNDGDSDNDGELDEFERYPGIDDRAIRGLNPMLDNLRLGGAAGGPSFSKSTNTTGKPNKAPLTDRLKKAQDNFNIPEKQFAQKHKKHGDEFGLKDVTNPTVRDQFNRPSMTS